MSNTIEYTLYASLFVQLLALVIGLYVQFRPISKQDKSKSLLRETRLLENVVPGIELTFYVLISLFVSNLLTTDIAHFRYYDWFFTTPIMLFTTMLYFIHVSYKNQSQSQFQSISTNHTKYSLIRIRSNHTYVLANAGMLLIGYLQELDITDIYIINHRFRIPSVEFLYFISIYSYTNI